MAEGLAPGWPLRKGGIVIIYVGGFLFVIGVLVGVGIATYLQDRDTRQRRREEALQEKIRQYEETIVKLSDIDERLAFDRMVDRGEGDVSPGRRQEIVEAHRQRVREIDRKAGVIPPPKDPKIVGKW